MLDNALRGAKDRILLQAALGMGQTIHPTTITLLAAVMGLVAVVLLAIQQYWLGLLFWMINRFLDGLDGTIARKNQLQTDFGGYLDIVLDFVVYAFIPVALVYANPSETMYLSLALMLAIFYINAASWMYLSAILEKRAHGAKAQGELTSVTMPTGIIGGAETVLFYCAFMIWPGYLFWLFNLMSILVVVSIIQRIIWAVHHIKAD